MTMRALETAKLLEADRVNVAVLHVPTIKPLDEATILREARRNGRLVVVAENHTVIGGLGEAVAGSAAARRRRRRSSGRWRCRTRSSTPARCRRCTTATASRPSAMADEHQGLAVAPARRKCLAAGPAHDINDAQGDIE